MVNYTINEIVRRSLALHGLPMHYYMDFLNIALQGARKINLETMPNVKAEKVAMNADYTLDIPSDCIDVISVGVEVADKVREIGKNTRLNERDNGGLAFPSVDEYNTYGQDEFASRFYENYFSRYGEFMGKLYGLGVQWSEEYKVIRSQGIIRVGNNTEYTDFHILYLAEPEKINGETAVHPFAEETLLDFIAWQVSKYRKIPNNRFDPIMKRKDFYNSYRILRSKRWKLSITDIKRAFRKRFKLSPKN